MHMEVQNVKKYFDRIGDSCGNGSHNFRLASATNV